MSILMEVFEEEFNRLERQKLSFEEKLLSFPRGYISKKVIRGNITYYLQYRDGEKIRSKYIPKSEIDHIQKQIQQRKQVEESLKRIDLDLKQLRKVLKK